MSKKITSEQLAKPGTEHAHQVAVFAWAAEHRRDSIPWQLLHAIPNGGERDPIVAGRMKAEGVKKGVLDLFMPEPRGQYAGCYIEMKKPGRERDKNGGMSDDQLLFATRVSQRHYFVRVCYSWIEAIDTIKQYLGEE